MRARAADGHSHCARNAGAGFAAGRRGCLTSSDSLFSFAPPFRSAYAIPEGGNPVGQSFLIRTEERNGRSWGAAETGAGGAKAEATGAGQKDVGRDRSRGAGRGCGTAARIERIRALSGVRERLEDEGRSGGDGGTAGAGERQGPGAVGAKAGQKDAGGTVPGVPGGDAERQRAQYRPVLCPVYGSGWETKVRSGEDGGTVGAGERRKREPEGRRLKRQGPGRKMPGRGRRGQKKAGRNREQGFGWPVRKLIFDGGSRQGVDSGAAGS